MALGGVLLIWLLQGAAVIFFAYKNAGDREAFGARLKRAASSPVVIGLLAGQVGFMIMNVRAASSGDGFGAWAATISMLVQLVALVIIVWRLLGARGGGTDLTFGSAKFASLSHATAQGLIGTDGLRLGSLRNTYPAESHLFSRHVRHQLQYTGERHLLTVAPTRAGKGVSVIIPNLLQYTGSAIAIDPKGENVAATYDARAAIGTVHVLDPWGITGKPAASFNPFDLLAPDSPTLIEDALLIADALVIPDGSLTTFWSDEARALVMGFILYIATDPAEVKERHLGRLRDILCAPPTTLAKIGGLMARSDVPAVAHAAARFLSKSDNERSGVLSTAQANTHFLDSPALRRSLTDSSFRFANLKGERPVSLYIVLPVDRLGTYNRWLRLLIALGIADLARNPVKPQRPVWFVLDEFAQLGQLKIIEDAYGLMAGLGLQLHAIVQDFSQLERLYDKGWQTFIANAGVIQVFGTRDLHTAEYISKMLGVTTQTLRSSSSSSGTDGSGKSTSGSTTSLSSGQRPLLFPDEVVRMDRDAQIIFVENADPLLASKLPRAVPPVTT